MFRSGAALLVAALACAPVTGAAPAYASPAPGATPAAHGKAHAIDGDTIVTRGRTVRVIGIDTPEEGQCGYGKAKRATERFVRGGVRLVNPRAVDDQDRYGRFLRYVRKPAGRDLGATLIRRGLAVARYDSKDGYDWHPRQRRYHRLDARQRNVCGFDPTDPGGGSGRGDGVYFPNCDAARRAGAAPLHRGEPGYRADLDADGDGVACE